MIKILTFKKRKDFVRVAKGYHVATRNMVLQAAPSLSVSNNISVGFTATKKIGNAVIRNKSKRRLRAIARETLKNFALDGVDYIFIARLSTATCDYKELLKDTSYALKRINKNFIVKNAEGITPDENPQK